MISSTSPLTQSETDVRLGEASLYAMPTLNDIPGIFYQISRRVLYDRLHSLLIFVNDESLQVSSSPTLRSVRDWLTTLPSTALQSIESSKILLDQFCC